MKKIIGLILMLAVVAPLQAQVMEIDIESLLEQLMDANDIDLIYEIEISDDEDVGGVAAVDVQQEENELGFIIIFYIDPQAMEELSVNTWAFILGHEIGHVLEEHIWDEENYSPEDEWSADVIGAQLAIDIEGDPYDYIDWLLAEGVCSMEHGCDIQRAMILATVFELDSSEWSFPEGHDHAVEDFLDSFDLHDRE